MSWFLFIILSVLTLGGGLGVVLTRNVVHAALLLLVSLVAVAGLYLILLAEFLALVQVLIYGGAIIIVLLFAIMLTRSAEYPRIRFAGGAFGGVLDPPPLRAIARAFR